MAYLLAMEIQGGNMLANICIFVAWRFEIILGISDIFFQTVYEIVFKWADELSAPNFKEWQEHSID